MGIIQEEVVRAGIFFFVHHKFHIMECPRMANMKGWQLSRGIDHGGIHRLELSSQISRWIDCIMIQTRIQNLSNISLQLYLLSMHFLCLQKAYTENKLVNNRSSNF